MKKCLLLSLAAGLTTISATAQMLQQKQTQLQQRFVSPAQLKADSAIAAVKGMPASEIAKMLPLATGAPGERVTLYTPSKKKANRNMAPAAAAEGFCLYGTVLSNDEWPIKTVTDPETGESFTYQETAYDLYTYDGTNLTAIGSDPEEIPTNYLISNGGGVVIGDEYLYNFNQSGWGQLIYNYYLAYNFKEGTLEGVYYDQDYTVVANQVAYDATTGKVYGQFYNDRHNGFIWGTRDIEMGFTEPIADMNSAALRALGFDRLGRAWAIDTNNDLLQIDKNSGLAKKIGPTGLKSLSGNIMSGAIDPKTDTFYFIGQTQDNISLGGFDDQPKYSTHLYTIDLTTGKATRVKDMPGNAMVAGAAFLPVTYSEAVPAEASNLTMTFDKDNLSGTLSFAAPTKTVGGQSLSSTELVVTLDGEVVKTMTASAGEKVSFEISVSNPDIHVAQVVASNEAGTGKPATLQQWVGLDAPVAVGDLTVKNTDYNNAKLTWTAPTIGIHGGYVDPAKLTYTVFNTDGAVEATGLTATELAVSKSGNALSRRGYKVFAFCGDLEGFADETARIYYGKPKQAPCTFEFESPNEFDLWQPVDANNDYHTWNYDFYGMFAQYKYSKENAANDFLFSPPIHLSTGQYYNLNSMIASEMGYYMERYSIHLAKSQSVDGIIKTIHEVTETDKNGIQAPQYYKLIDPFFVDEEGDYYIAYYCCSDADRLGLQVHSVQVEKGANDGAPAAAKGTIKAGDKGGLSATVTFVAPTTDTHGNQISELNKAELYNGDKLAATLRGIEPGKTYDITDKDLAKQGVNTYRLYIFNDEGKGLPTEFSVFVGTDAPGYCENADLNLVDGNVHITWDAPSKGKNGGYINPDGINYSIGRQTDYTETYNGRDTECYDYDFPFFGDQIQVQYGIFPTNIAGEGPGTATPTMIGGDAYTMPFEETFGSTESTSLWVLGYNPLANARITVEEEPSYDADGYNLTCTSTGVTGGRLNVSSGKILIKGSKPTLTFAVQGTSDKHRVQLRITTDGVLEHVKPMGECFTSKGEWKLVGYDLTPYVGKEVLFDFNCIVSGRGSLYIDDVRVNNNGLEGIEDLAEGIDTVIAPTTSSAIYDLSGRRINNANGVVISNGQKILK